MTPTQFRAGRKRLGMTQSEFAAALGYRGGKVTIYRKETGRQAVTERDALALEALLRRAGV